MSEARDSAALEERVRALEHQVATLRDLEAIRELRRRYHELVNEGHHDALRELFTPDARVHFGDFGEAHGAEALRELFGTKLFGDAVTFIKQFVHNHSVEVAGDRATGFCYLEAKTVTDGTSLFVAGRYDDEYVRTREGWRFVGMRLRTSFAVPMGRGWREGSAPALGGSRS